MFYFFVIVVLFFFVVIEVPEGGSAGDREAGDNDGDRQDKEDRGYHAVGASLSSSQ
jgi:hypothetical protein